MFYEEFIVSINIQQRLLAQLQPGQRAVIREIFSEMGQRIRLLEMGLLPGTIVECMRIAPLGDALLIKVRGALLSIRRSEAFAIALEVCPA
jgi:ferrous iron transport protein A